MKALILAAGKGTRLRPLTYAVPKPMIPVLDKPVMEFLVELLARHGVRQIMVNTSYRAPDIENYFRNGARWDVELGYSFEGRIEDGRMVDEPVGSAGAIRKIQEHSGFFDEPFVVLCGDAIVDLDLTALLAAHQASKALVTIALAEVPREEVPSYGVVVSDAAGRISEFQEKPTVAEARSTTVNTGIYIFDPTVIDFIPAGRAYDIGGQLFPALIQQGAALFGATLPFQWLDIGKLADYFRVVTMAVSGEINGLTVRGTEISPGITVGLNVRIDPATSHLVGPVYIGAGSCIEPGTTIIGPSVIGRGSLIKTGAHVQESILFDYTSVSAHARLNRMLVCDGQLMDAEGAAVDLAKADLNWLLDDSRVTAKPLSWEQENLLQMINDW
jgi:mannose-1-phosphate guanylyltransferase